MNSAVDPVTMHMFREMLTTFREECAADREKFTRQCEMDHKKFTRQCEMDREVFIYEIRQMRDDQCIVKISKDCITQVLANIAAVCAGNIIADKFGKYN